MPKRYLTATAIAAALALTACSDHDEGADLPDRLEFTATNTAAEGPAVAAICGQVGATWFVEVSGVSSGVIQVGSDRPLGVHRCARDGLQIECVGEVGSMFMDLESESSGTGGYAYEAPSGSRCSVAFTLAAR